MGRFQAKTRELVECVRAGPETSSCFADGLRTMEVSERILPMDLLK